MELKNLKRAAEIAQKLEPLKTALSIMSKEKFKHTVTGIANKGYEETVELPPETKHYMLATLNKLIKEYEDEAKGL